MEEHGEVSELLGNLVCRRGEPRADPEPHVQHEDAADGEPPEEVVEAVSDEDEIRRGPSALG